MGQVASQPAPSGFSAVWEALPEATREEMSALASKASTTLTRPHPAAPQPLCISIHTDQDCGSICRFLRPSNG